MQYFSMNLQVFLKGKGDRKEEKDTLRAEFMLTSKIE